MIQAQADAEPHDRTVVGVVRALVVIQLYPLVAYLSAAVIPYLWTPRPYPPTWIWIVPGWLLGAPGFWITAAGPALALSIAVLGASVVALARDAVPRRLHLWCVASVGTATTWALFTFTPLAQHIAAFVAD